MLPIDDAAKSGAWVWALARSGATMRQIRWDSSEPLPGAHWVSAQGTIHDDDAFTHYLPASWVEHAAKMREALKEVNRAIYSDDYANAALLTDFNQGLVDSALAATEWPKKEKADV